MSIWQDSVNIAAAAVLAVLVGSSPVLSAGPPIQVLVLEGDNIPGVGNVTSINNIAINIDGDWLVEADTDNPDTDADSVLLRSGALFLREGDPIAAPVGALLDSFDSVTLNDSGQSGFNFFLDGTAGSLDDSGVYAYLDTGAPAFDGVVLVVQESEEAPGFTPGTPFIGFFDVKINGVGELLVIASVDDPNISSSVDRGVYILTTDAMNGGISSFNLVAAEGDVLPGLMGTIADFGTSPHESAINDSGNLLLLVESAADSIYLYDGSFTLIAQVGSVSPVPGRNWQSFGLSKLSLGNNGDTAYSGTLDGDADSNLLIVRNGAKFIQEGDTLPAIGGVFSFTTFGSGPLEVSSSGGLLWYGDWDDPDTDVDTGLFLDETLVVQEGVTEIPGVGIIDTLRGVEDGYHMSSDGNHIIFEAILENGLEGAFLMETPVVACPVEFSRGDCNQDGNYDVGDVIFTLAYLFSNGPNPACCSSCNVNGDGSVNIADAIASLEYLFGDGPPPPGPFGDCGCPDQPGLDCGCFAPCTPEPGNVCDPGANACP